MLAPAFDKGAANRTTQSCIRRYDSEIRNACDASMSIRNRTGMRRYTVAIVSYGDLVELVKRRKTHAPPPSIVWEALNDPSRSTRSWSWFVPLDGEIVPTVISSSKPHSVVWGSIWQDRLELRIQFELEPDGPGSFVTWRLFGRSNEFDAEDLSRRRHRLNYLINGQLRAYFDL